MDDPNGYLTPLAMDVEVKHNKDSPDEILLVDSQQSKNIYYYIDDNNNISQLDYEGNPNDLQAKKISLIQEGEEQQQTVGEGGSNAGQIISPMPGRVVKVFCEVGQKVEQGDVLISIESMKMEYNVKAKASGVVTQILADPDDQVKMKQVLVEME